MVQTNCRTGRQREVKPPGRKAQDATFAIGTDRRFLDAYMPDIENFLHYRSIDVSTAKELARRWNPKVFQGVPKKETSHRALDDIRESIAAVKSTQS